MNWYDEEVDQLIQQRDALPYEAKTVFYGSSSIRLWENLYEDFKPYEPVNLGFGGSTLEACVYYFERIVAPVQSAQKIIVYAGDNDLGDGKTPGEVLDYFTQLYGLLRHYFPDHSCYYISVKPSISRWNINDNIKHVNHLISTYIQEQQNISFINIYDAMLNEQEYPNADYFDEDGLHLSEKGYEVWKRILLAQIFAA